MHRPAVIVALCVLASSALATASSVSSFDKRQEGCTFDSWKRPGCWKGGLDIKTNYYTNFPLTNKVLKLNWTIEEIEKDPDGMKRMVTAINGKVPGPTIEADWGDTIGMRNSEHFLSGHNF
jgi:hypothetical protein